MPEDRDRGNRSFSQYDSMLTEALEEILRLDAEAPMEQESDTELILYVMEVLANRNTNNTGKTAQESWDSFQQHYLPVEEELPENTPEAEKPKRSAQPWLRRLMAAAAAIVLVLCVPLTARALGWEDIWKVVAKWAKETFSFVSSEDANISEPSPEYDGEYTSLQVLLEKNKVDTNLIPTWIPDGYSLKNVDKDITPVLEVYIAHYVNGDKDLTLQVQTYISTDLYNFEIEEDIIEIYTSSGNEYFICKNMEQIQVIWVDGSYECNISGDLSIDEAKAMIDSIKKG